jgi:hypothetical protein
MHHYLERNADLILSMYPGASIKQNHRADSDVKQLWQLISAISSAAGVPNAQAILINISIEKMVGGKSDSSSKVKRYSNAI